jgi:hypothetical protein
MLPSSESVYLIIQSKLNILNQISIKIKENVVFNKNFMIFQSGLH